MPYEITDDEDGGVTLRKKDTGKKVAKLKTRKAAEAMIRAIYANENKGK